MSVGKVPQYTHEGEDNLCLLVLYYLVSPRGQTLVIRLDGNGLFPTESPCQPTLFFFFFFWYSFIFRFLELISSSNSLHVVRSF